MPPDNGLGLYDREGVLPQRPVFSNFDRMILVCLYRIAPRILIMAFGRTGLGTKTRPCIAQLSALASCGHIPFSADFIIRYVRI